MKNFSLYELLSYLIPGFLLLKIAGFYLSNFQFTFLTALDNDLNNNIFFLVISLILGVAIHLFTFRIKDLPSYRNDVYVSFDKLKAESEELQKLIPLVESIVIKKADESAFDKIYIFDYAYYYLDVNHKINKAKSFQSFYYLFRNIYTVLLLTIPLLLYKVLVIFKNQQLIQCNQLLTLFFIFLLFPVSVWCARFMRLKLFVCVFWSYYIDHIHKTK